MANQMIALQARVPQTDILGGAIQRNAQMMNMMAQQQAAQRQAEQAQQTMRIQASQEERAAALAKPQMEKAGAEAELARINTGLKFHEYTIEGLKQARTPEDAVKIGGWLKSQFANPVYQQAVDRALSSLPRDPSLFEPWRQQTMFQSMQSEKQLTQHFNEVTNGGATWTQAMPEYAGAPVQGATEVPGSRVAAPQGITYIKDAQGNIIPMPTKMVGGDASGPGLVTGERGGGAGALATNPGALKDSPFARSQPGYTGAKGGFATFASPEAGIAAQENLLRGSYIGKGFDTINKIVDRYAPAGAENSAASVANYKQYIAQRTGIDPSKPIAASQVPAVAAAMREFETGQRPGGKPAGGIEFGKPIPGTGPQAEGEASRKKIAGDFQRISGVNLLTGEDPVHALIAGSTSGGAEQLGAAAKAFIPESLGGGATSGMKNIQALKTLKSTLMLALMPGGRLSTGVSDEDRKAIEAQLANIDDPSIPASARLRGWYEVLRIMRSNAGVTTQAPRAAAPAAKPKSGGLPPDIAKQYGL